MRAIVLSLTAGALALAACQPRPVVNAAAAAVPVLTTAASALPPAPPSTAELAYAPEAPMLHERRPLRLAWVGPKRRYAWLDGAYWVDEVYGEAPPDYAFDYDDVGPVAWLDGDFVVLIGEPVAEGMRFYYYEPGRPWPYFVQDPSYGYAFEEGALAAVYAVDGDPIPEDLARGRLAFAERYFARGASLELAARQGDRRQVSLAAWHADARALEARRAAWDRTLARDQAWRLYHADHGPQALARWARERDWRIAEADVARSAVQRPPVVASAAQQGPAARQALARAWQDQRALVDHQAAASQAAEDQLARARAFAASRGAYDGVRRPAAAPGGAVGHRPGSRRYAMGEARTAGPLLQRRLSASRERLDGPWAPRPYRMAQAEARGGDRFEASGRAEGGREPKRD